MNIIARGLLTMIASISLAGHFTAQAQSSAFSVGGTATGLASGKSLTLLNNGSNALTVSANGSFTFTNLQSSGTSYSVTVAIQPLGQICSVTNGTGTIVNASIGDISVTCTSTFTVSGSVTGLTAAGLVLKLNSTNLIVAIGASSFKFSTALTTGTAYAVTVGIQPVGQTCAISNGSGVIAGANVTNVGISCSTTFTVGGTITGLNASGLVIKLNGGTSKIVSVGSTTFKFSTALTTGTSFAVTVSSQPNGQVCLISNGSGTIGSANVTNVSIICNSTPVISGIPATTATTDSTYTFTPSATDANGDPLGFSIINKPVWSIFNTANGSLTGTPTTTGTYPNIGISVSDGISSAALPAFTISVIPGAGSVELTWTKPDQNIDGSALSDLIGYSIYFGTDASNLDSSIGILGANTTTATISGLGSGTTYYFAIASIIASGEESDPSPEVSAIVN